MQNIVWITFFGKTFWPNCYIRRNFRRIARQPLTISINGANILTFLSATKITKTKQDHIGIALNIILYIYF